MQASCLDDVTPVIGYRATRMLAAWFAGQRLSVPVRYVEGHPLAKLIGAAALRALVREFPGERLCIPSERADGAMFTMRRVAERLAWGWSPERIAEDLGLSSRRVTQLRVELVELGWLEYAQGFQAAKAQARRDAGAATPPKILGTSEGFDDSPSPGGEDTAAPSARGRIAREVARFTRAA